MKMLLIVFREPMAEQVHALLNEYEVTAFTELHNVSGRGETGPTVQFSLSAGTNRLILAVVPEQTSHRLIQGLIRFRTEQGQRQGNNLVPLHAFVLPCDQVV